MSNNPFDLTDRTAIFAENIIITCKKIHISPINKRIIEQIVGSSGSVGANYAEATEAMSKKDFIHKMTIAIKECKETKHWIRLLAKADPEVKPDLADLWKEANELTLIFAKCISTKRLSK